MSPEKSAPPMRSHSYQYSWLKPAEYRAQSGNAFFVVPTVPYRFGRECAVHVVGIFGVEVVLGETGAFAGDGSQAFC